MKKLMMAVAIVCAAALSQAVTITWGSGKIAADSQNNAVKAKDLITAYAFEITAADYATYSAMGAEELSKTLGAALQNGELPGTFSALTPLNNSYTAKGGATANVVGATDYAVGTTAYAAIIYKDNANADWYLANVASVAIEAASDFTYTGMFNTIGGAEAAGGSTAWAQAVPEPTSGLLLLLGLAGLALKRKQA